MSERIKNLETNLAAAREAAMRGEYDAKPALNRRVSELSSQLTLAREAAREQADRARVEAIRSATAETINGPIDEARSALAALDANPLARAVSSAVPILDAAEARLRQLATQTSTGPSPEVLAAAREVRTRFEALRRVNPIAAAAMAEQCGPQLDLTANE